MITWVIISGLLYLLLLFIIAAKAETLNENSRWIKNPWIHTFALAVYCTGWTFYGGVGRASLHGLDFLTICIGPTIMLALGYGIIQKIFKICKQLHLTSIADFISVRFGNSATLGVLVTICCIVGLVPYIALQLKAIVDSLHYIEYAEMASVFETKNERSLIPIVTTIVLAIFSILYGARKLDTSEKHRGLMAVIAFESVFKMLVLLIIGLVIVFGVFDGFGDMVSKVSSVQNVTNLFTIKDNSSYATWMAMLCLSGFAILLLPRQFQINFIENDSTQNINHATWALPIYLLIVNLVILPIGLCGIYFFNGTNVLPDSYVLAIPIQMKSFGLAIFTWLGGLSAASGMIIIETIALSIMVSNNIVIPIFLKATTKNNILSKDISKRVLQIRRWSILGVLFLALVFYFLLAGNISLIDIGLVSFGAVANFAPAIFLGLFSKNVSKNGIVAGLCVGFAFWFYTSFFPQIADSNLFFKQIFNEGFLGLDFLRPNSLFGITVLEPLVHSLFWSLGSNIIITVLVSLFSKKTILESYYAEIYVDNNKFDTILNIDVAWRGQAHINDLYQVLGQFIGIERAKLLINKYADKNKININTSLNDQSKLVVFTERLLGGLIGTTAARSLIKSTTNEEEISLNEMYVIIKENQLVRENHKALLKKSNELQKATLALKMANDDLNKANQLKNEFLYTVTHELKTPLTSIIALSEIVHDNPELSIDERNLYLQSVIDESNRLSNLINQVLKIEKFEAGKQAIHITKVDLIKLIKETISRFDGVFINNQLQIETQFSDTQIIVNCDNDMIRQVLVNLIGNAIKYAQNQILIEVVLNDLHCKICIHDDGKGINNEEKDLLFDKFYQAKNQNLRKPEGNGLGLAISKKIIDLHEGEIWVATNFETGAHFIFTIPLHLKVQ